MSGSRRLGLAVVLVALLSAGCGGLNPSASVVPVPAASTAPAGPITQRSEGGDVTVEATWAGPGSEARFDVKLDTHSVDLDALDLADAVLRNDLGDTLTARRWDAPKGGHHRVGVLTFEGDAAGLLGDARWIELVITGVGGVRERVLRWDVVP